MRSDTLIHVLFFSSFAILSLLYVVQPSCTPQKTTPFFSSPSALQSPFDTRCSYTAVRKHKQLCATLFSFGLSAVFLNIFLLILLLVSFFVPLARLLFFCHASPPYFFLFEEKELSFFFFFLLFFFVGVFVWGFRFVLLTGLLLRASDRWAGKKKVKKIEQTK